MNRLAFANENLDDIIASADAPFENVDSSWWLDSDEPWQTLAACIEIRNALRSPNPENFVSHLPIHQVLTIDLFLSGYVLCCDSNPQPRTPLRLSCRHTIITAWPLSVTHGRALSSCQCPGGPCSGRRQAAWMVNQSFPGTLCQERVGMHAWLHSQPSATGAAYEERRFVHNLINIPKDSSIPIIGYLVAD